MNKIVLALGLSLSMSMAAPAMAAMDLGGNLQERIREVEALTVARQGGDFHIPKICVSACTLYLNLPHVCVEPGTLLGFHQASDDNGKRDDLGTDIAKAYLPPAIAAWGDAHHAFDQFEPTAMTAEVAWSLGVKRCDDNQH